MTIPQRAANPSSNVDPRPRELLEKYASLTGGLVLEVAEGLLDFEVPARERSFWRGTHSVRMAVSPEALDEDPAAELLCLGSPAFGRLLDAIRARGCLDELGVLPAVVEPAQATATLPVPVRAADATAGAMQLVLLPVGRLLARASIKAGPILQERLVETPAVDLSTGVALSAEDAEAFAALAGAEATQPPVGAASVARKPTSDLVPLLFGHLESRLGEDIGVLRREAEVSCLREVERLERYYGAMLDEVEVEDDADSARARKQAIRAELERRTSEERNRYVVRVTVHPVQLVEWRVLAQRATWRLTSQGGRQAEVSASRLLIGSGTWRLPCPSCGGPTSSLDVCQESHACCPDCSAVCGVCGEAACRAHGVGQCVTEGHAVCPTDSRTCGSCGALHCRVHAGYCAVGDHEVCPRCSLQCGRCHQAICNAHGTRTATGAPLGARWLCAACTVLCEGGSNEPVGLDEVVRCSSCERHICTLHQTTCAVDGAAHCSRHLRRSDRSGRLVCGQHRAACADEPGAILASDEAKACSTCERVVCEAHSGTCAVDMASHCTSHLLPLADLPGRFGCEAHRTSCHVDGLSFTIGGTRACSVCGLATCESHLAACASCARRVCKKDLEAGRCLTCEKLEVSSDPSDDLIQAALAANDGEPPKARSWRTARDATGTVVELELGWTRRLVFSVRHGELRPKTIVHHSILGSRRKR